MLLLDANHTSRMLLLLGLLFICTQSQRTSKKENRGETSELKLNKESRK